MNKGFSLVELSIVLVILGLLTGGILAGQNLIRAAELRSLSTQTDHYRTALYTFRDKYFSLPGDMRNAVKFWGAQAGGTADGINATCAALTHTSPATDERTCNGNGDGNIDDASNTYPHERYRFWQHLANAGLIEGSYTGVGGVSGVNDAVIGENVPAARISNTGFSVKYWVTSSCVDIFCHGPQNTMTIGDESYGNAMTRGPILSPEEMWNLDTKLDDGKPGTGWVRNYPTGGAYDDGCTSSATQSTAEYVFSETAKVCGIYLLLESY